MDKLSKISTLSSIILVGFTTAVMLHYIMGSYLNLPFPFNTFLFSPNMHFSDFWVMVPREKLAPFFGNYFPLASILLTPFLVIKNKLIAYLIFAAGFVAFLLWMNIKTFKCENLTKAENFRNIFIISVLSYPILYILDRGNVDMYLLMLFAGFVYCFKREKYLLSAVLIAVQNAIKPFPILFLLLFLFKKKYKEFFLSLILTGILVIGGFMVLKGGFYENLNAFIKNLATFKSLYVYDLNNANAMTNSSSLFMALKFMLCKYNSVISTIQLGKIYQFLSLGIGGIVLFFTWREKKFWKQITFLTLLMLLLPYFIADYKLIFLFLPLWLFVEEGEKTKFDLAYCILFGLLMVPKQFFVLLLHTNGLLQLTTFGIIINPILMLIFLGLLIAEQFQVKK